MDYTDSEQGQYDHLSDQHSQEEVMQRWHMSRVRVIGTYQGKPYTWESDSEYPVRDEYGDLQIFYWAEHNMSCDCNRDRFLPPELGIEELDCGDTVLIDRIEALDGSGVVIELNESTEGKA